MNDAVEVLVVDDDPDLAESLEVVLISAGYRTRQASNGRAALQAVEVSMPSLILLDMMMPVMDGWQFARAFKDRYGSAAPIVVVTAAEQVRRRAEEVGASGFLPKPFDVDDLLRVVARCLEGPRA